MTRTKLEVAVLAIVLAIFASLISVAILEARTAARKMSSRNNLKQIGLGIENHESVHKRLPSGCDEGAMHGWMSTILPLIEASTWYNTVDFDVSWEHPFNCHHFMVSIPSYCRPDLERKYTKEGYGITCYHANPALLYRDSKVNLSDLPAGRSNIWLAGEIKGNHTPFGYPYNWRVLSHPINFGPDSFGGWQDGATFVLADGSIKFIKNNIDESVLKNIANTVPLPAMELYDIPSRRFECGAASSQLKIECSEIKDEHSKGGPPHSVVYFSADERADFIDFVHGIVNVEEVIKNYPQAKTLRAAYPQNQNELELICGLNELETLGLMSQFEFPDRPKPAQIGLSNLIIGLQQLPKLKFLKLRVSQIELGSIQEGLPNCEVFPDSNRAPRSFRK